MKPDNLYDRMIEMANEGMKKHFPDGFSIWDEANALVARAFGNGPIENLHPGEPGEGDQNR